MAVGLFYILPIILIFHIYTSLLQDDSALCTVSCHITCFTPSDHRSRVHAKFKQLTLLILSPSSLLQIIYPILQQAQLLKQRYCCGDEQQQWWP